MRFKHDENLHPDRAEFLAKRGHDACTVRSQGLKGHPDDEIASVCRTEERVLVTLDLDFADVRRYPPQQSPGLIVLRLHNESRTSVIAILEGLIPLLEKESPAGCLWIVEEHRVRIHGPEPRENL